LLNWYTKKKKKGLDLQNFDCCHQKKKKKINILEFGRELGKQIGHWEFMLLFIFFLGSIII
jgi:hypothetical protein